MARIRSCTTLRVEPLSASWQCASTAAGAVASPDTLPALSWIAATVPGTFASALRAAGAWNGEPPLELDHHDIWYRARFNGGGEETLCFEGLATIAEVWLNGTLLFRSDNMFLPRRVTLHTQRCNDLHICFRSLTAWLAGQRGRARWRPRLASPAALRSARTTLLGRMPGWCPTIHPVGPWRAVLREHCEGRAGVAGVDLRTSVRDGAGVLAIRAELDTTADVTAELEVSGRSMRLARTGQQTLGGEIGIPDAALWWPHTHGTPTLHPVTLRVDDAAYTFDPIGFRHIEQVSTDGGFALAVNNQAVFCRGACWTSPEIIALPGDAAAYRPWLTAMRDAHMNMVRIGGTMVYETDEFFALCDELGLMVWQDAMLANFDYPGTEEFRASLSAELAAFLDRTQANASVAVFCGGSEVLQQAAMLGVPAEKLDASLYTDHIAALVREVRPDLVYVPNSPWGEPSPFLPGNGVAHYYGVGAYLRPLEDARRADVRFASECLALANVPCAATVEALGVATTTDPRWKRAVPRDPGAGWDFEDVRDHYLRALFGVDPAQLRWSDFSRYLELSRAVSCQLMAAVFSEWRRVGSACAGGLVYQLQDLTPGAGWGVIDARGRPKPAWHALRRALRPRQVLLTDEGLNGLDVHIVNESPQPLHAVLRLTCLRDGAHIAREATRDITLPPRHAVRHRSAALLPAFFDITYAYRFGPRAHDVTVASLYDAEDNTVIADAVHFPAGPALPPRDLGLQASVTRDGDVWQLRVCSQAFAAFLHIEDPAFAAEDDWLHLPPGRDQVIALRALGDAGAVPEGEIHALNMDRVVRYSGRA